MVACPNPGPKRLAMELTGRFEHLHFRVYTSALIMVAELDAGAQGPGWSWMDLPADVMASLSPGTYYLRPVEDRNVSVCRLVILP